MLYKEKMAQIKAIIEDAADIRDEIKECMDWHYGNDSPPNKVLGSSGRTVYSTGKIETDEGEEIYLALKLYPCKNNPDTAKEEIIREIALFDHFNELGMPVPGFSVMIEADGRYGTLTEDLTHDIRYKLMEFYSDRQKLKQIENYQELLALTILEWEEVFCENGFDGVPFSSLFVQKDEKNRGKLVFADLDSRNMRHIPDGIMKEFHERYPDKEYELVL
ncbi:MAG: hypothetical protein U9P44_00505 [archaeon]|nr:hypothetical protein [archaeon]